MLSRLSRPLTASAAVRNIWKCTTTLHYRNMSTRHQHHHEQEFQPEPPQEMMQQLPSQHHPHESTQTFVSAHQKWDPSQISQFLSRKKQPFKLKPDGHFAVRNCPFCHDTRGKSDNLWKLQIFSNGGCHCVRCGTKTSFFDYRNAMNECAPVQSVAQLSTTGGEEHTWEPLDQKEVQQYEENLFRAEFRPVLEYLLKKRGLTEETLRMYGVGAGMFKFIGQDERGEPCWVDSPCVTFPTADLLAHSASSQKSVTRLKVRSVLEKKHMRLHPSRGPIGFFGWHTLIASCKAVIITEGEYDAMAVFQATRFPTISLPNGASSFPPSLLPCLEHFETIYLWMDDDTAGRKGAQKFAKKLGIQRVKMIHSRSPDSTSGPKDANDALLQGLDLEQMLRSATPPSHHRIAKYADLEADVLAELKSKGVSEINGVPMETLPKLTEMMKGHRRGELTVLTGGTGTGKTTIQSQISVDLCKQGVRTLWGSFEVKNSRLIQTMLCQFSGKDIAEELYHNPERFQMYAEQFAQLPMYFMTFHGSSATDEVLDAMEHAVYAYDVEHILLDNLQFMIVNDSSSSWRYDAQDKAVAAFRKFATEHDVHITLCVHPRKEGEGTVLGIASVIGSAKVTQEADNVLLIQKLKGRPTDSRSIALAILDEFEEVEGEEEMLEEAKKMEFRTLHLEKNRYDGTLGHMPYIFDRKSKRIIPVTQEQAWQLRESFSGQNESGGRGGGGYSQYSQPKSKSRFG